MSVIEHHIPDDVIQAYAAGSLSHAFSVVVAAHISMCDRCRTRLEAHEAAGGVVLENVAEQPIDGDLKDRVLAALDELVVEAPDYKASGVFPAPVMAALSGRPPKWRSVGGGIRQKILSADETGSVRLLYIPKGEAVPDHGHNGLELTLVLQGSFSDETGRYGVGDVEVAREDLDHTPMAGIEAPCICLAATDAPLRFNSFLPRLLQPMFRI